MEKGSPIRTVLTEAYRSSRPGCGQDRKEGRNTPASLRGLQSVAGTPFGEEPLIMPIGLWGTEQGREGRE